MPKGKSVSHLPERTCKVEGCMGKYNCRGYCARHIAFIRRRGSIEAQRLGTGKGYAEEATALGEFCGVTVYQTVSGRYFVMSSNGNKGIRRTYGSLTLCPGCINRFFNAYPKTQRYCTNGCNKKGDRNWLVKRVLDRGTISPSVADAWFQQIVRSSGKCHRCGATENLECAHIISRQYHATRWIKDNALCLCEDCHKYFTRFPLDWEEYAIQAIGPLCYQGLRGSALARAPVDFKVLLVELAAISGRTYRKAA